MTRCKTAILLVASILVFSCSGKNDVRMNNLISIYDPDTYGTDRWVPMDVLECDIAGGSETVVIVSKVPYQARLERNLAEKSDWISFRELGIDPKSKGTLHVIEYEPSKEAARRSCVLAATNTEHYAGQFLPVRQGFASRLFCDFSWLNYGAADPTVEGGEKLISEWNDVQKGYGYSTTLEEGKVPAVFGRNGFVILGSKTSRADLITPYAESITSDSIAVVSFNAFRYTDIDGVTDASTLTVELLGGARFCDTKETVRTMTPGTYDPYNAVASMKESTASFFFIETPADSDRLPSTTRLRFISGPSDDESPASRVILDNIGIYAVPSTYYKKYL